MGDRVEAFAAIWGKATGGRSVAVDPHLKDRAVSFTVPAAPGVQEACDWLRDLTAGKSNSQRMVFLVGGPGGGKSHAVSRMTAGLTEEEAADTGLAQRKYYFRAGESRLVVVNDASIRGEHDRHPLADDVDEAVSEGDGFLGCVNRGILVEEAHALAGDSPGASIVRWLAGGHAVQTDFPMVAAESGPIIAKAKLLRGEATLEVVAVSVDHCSLFEVRPNVGEGLNAEKYKVKRLKQRSAADTLLMPAGSLLSAVVEHLAESAASGPQNVDPIQANVSSLQAQSVQSGLLTVLRSAEAVAGSRMTFREVWGAILRATAGNLPQLGDPVALAKMFPPLAPQLDAFGHFREMRRRARHRMSESIFGVDLSIDSRAIDPVLRITAPVDPVLDAVPGRLGDDPFGWASPVLDAFSGLVTAVSPLQTVLESIEDDDAFHDIVTDFDWAVDSAFVAVTQPEGIDEQARRDIVGWYGDYLSRLYALSNGVSAYREEVSAWLDTRTSLPSAIERALKTLLRPSRDPNDPQSGYVIPLFSSRTVPITGAALEPQLVLQGEDAVHLKLRQRGDAVSVEMSELGTPVGEIALDFALIRSALACASQRLGVTEQAARVSPRVERFRAKRLVPARIVESEFRLVIGRDLTDVYLER